MKDIRFRAWACGHNRMVEWDEITLNAAQGLCDLHDYIDEDTPGYEFILMQFIGLFDKQGVEMYEGDIVRTPAGLSVIEFDKGIFGLNHDYGTDNKTMLGSWGTQTNLRGLDDGYNDDCIVVGDIYRNPELLK